MIKLNLQISDIEYKTLMNITNLARERGGVKSAFFGLLLKGADALISREKLNQLAVHTLNNGSAMISRALTDMLNGEGLKINISDIRAANSESGGYITLDLLAECDVCAVFGALLPELGAALAESERFRFVSAFLGSSPQAAKAAVAALAENLEKPAQERLIADGINAFYDELLQLFSRLLAKNDVHATLNTLSAAVASSASFAGEAPAAEEAETGASADSAITK